MGQSTPRVSIGLPVFNGEKYLEQSLQSILNQTYADIEVVIADNASTDRTEEICRSYAAQDRRIHYERNPVNIGGAKNHNLTFRRSHGEFFRWAAHDDICDPNLVSECLQILEQDAGIVVAYSMVIEMDEVKGRTNLISTRVGMAEKPWQRFKQLISRDHACESTYGLLRAETLRKTRLLQDYTDSDRTLLSELSLYGRFYEIPRPLFYKRHHPQNIYVDWRTRMAWFQTAHQGKITLPFWAQFFDYLYIVKNTPLTPQDRLRCYSILLGVWLGANSKRMAKDVLFAVQMGLHSKTWREKRYVQTNNWS